MKHIVFLAIMACAVPAWGQDKPTPKDEPVKPIAQAEKPKQTASGAPRIPNPRRWKEDARHCLERPTNTEVIKCAEEFL